MKKTKKLISLITAVITLTVLFAFGVSAEEFTEGYYTYIVEDGEATIITVDTSISGDVVVPDTLGGYPVVCIGENAFLKCENLTSIIIPDTVTNIGTLAFENCYNLQSIDLSDNITKIENGTFENCNRLKNISIPDNVVYIGRVAFRNCYCLTSLTFPDSLEVIDFGAFISCFNLSEVTFGKNLTTIGEGAFATCVSLTNINLPKKLETLDDFVFEECLSIKEISIPESVKTIGSEAFFDCINLNKIEILGKDTVINGNESFGFSSIGINEDKITKSELAEKLCQAFQLCLESDSTDAIETASAYQAKAVMEEYCYNVDNSIKNEDTTIHGYAGSTAETYAKENGFKFEEIKENTTVIVTDTNTNVTAEYDLSVFDGDANLVITPNGENANIIFNGKFGKFISYDISFEIDGEKVQPDGKVTIKIPLPDGYNPNATKVFYVDSNGHKTKLDSSYADGYIIFETDHFSEYVLVDESSEITEPSTEPDEPATEPETSDEPIEDNCDHLCHKSGFMGFIWKIVRFFVKLFKAMPVCDCGAAHY